MEDFSEINRNLNKKILSTPKFDKNVFGFKGELISIDSYIINIILNDINEKFEIANFSLCNTEGEVLENLYKIESSSIGNINLNFNKKETELNFLKSFVSEIIEEKYKTSNFIGLLKNKIEKKLNDIKEEIYKCNDINKFNLYERFLKKFNTDAIPEFLKRNILDEIETKKLINEFSQNSEKEKIKFNTIFYNKNNNDEDNLIRYYYQLINKKLIPFQGGDRETIFQIFLYSNLKDIKNIYIMKEYQNLKMQLIIEKKIFILIIN